ncbi:hypothetical protein ABZ942_18110 [Nocardia sp. NPDC046473]|uniref:hypothetical protein n=1 Tax=Nocardia sp. NPDC046473 TaxID=3155733 RepID=UPI0033CFB9ED
MRPLRGSGPDPNVDPAVEAAYRGLMDAVDDLRTVRIRLDNFDLQAFLDEPTEIDEEFMRLLAARPGASPELVAFAIRVQNGECRWPDIEALARPWPPELAELRTSDRFIWKWTPETPVTQPDSHISARADPSVVGPSDWPDDFDDYPGRKSWLV